MKIKTSELTDTQLDWAVAKCEGYECEFGDEVSGPWLVPQEGYLHDEKPLASFRPSTDWNLAGPIIKQEGITVMVTDIERHDDGTITFANKWKAATPQQVLDCDDGSYGPTPLIAAMRAYVMAKLGDEINIPEELK